MLSKKVLRKSTFYLAGQDPQLFTISVDASRECERRIQPPGTYIPVGTPP